MKSVHFGQMSLDLNKYLLKRINPPEVCLRVLIIIQHHNTHINSPLEICNNSIKVVRVLIMAIYVQIPLFGR